MKILSKVVYTSVVISLIGTSYIYGNTEHKENINKSKTLTYYSYKEININDIFTIGEKIDSENDEFFKADIKYPYLKIKNQYVNKVDTNSRIIDNINNQILNTVTKFKNEIKIAAKEYKELYEKEPNNNQYVKYQYDVVSQYKVSFNKNNILSIPITMYEFTGGAHGLTNIKTFNYDLLTGKELKLKDLFKENSNYKEIINKYINDEISKDTSIYFEDAFKGISDNQSYYISDEGIVIYFSLYDIAPYSTGIPMFTITWNQIIDYLENPNISK